jgi:hypothetical protein
MVIRMAEDHGRILARGKTGLYKEIKPLRPNHLRRHTLPLEGLFTPLLNRSGVRLAAQRCGVALIDQAVAPARAFI